MAGITVVNAGTLTVAASTTTNITGVGGSNYNPTSVDSAEATLYVRNTTGSSVTVSWISTPLEG